MDMENNISKIMTSIKEIIFKENFMEKVIKY